MKIVITRHMHYMSILRRRPYTITTVIVSTKQLTLVSGSGILSHAIRFSFGNTTGNLYTWSCVYRGGSPPYSGFGP